MQLSFQFGEGYIGRKCEVYPVPERGQDRFYIAPNGEAQSSVIVHDQDIFRSGMRAHGQFKVPAMSWVSATPVMRSRFWSHSGRKPLMPAKMRGTLETGRDGISG
ncbi:MAG: hypothetical protein IPL11_10995 [Candidatus Accumulibacter sp.]|nr:hypothetical protein [Accumulibacter sp.]